MSGGRKKGKKEDATKTLVGARPIKMLQAEKRQKLRETSVPFTAPTAIPLKPVEDSPAPPFMPEPPRSLEATGLPTAFVESLCLKHLFLAGELRGGEISMRTCLPPVVIEEVMERLIKGRLVEIKGTRGVGIGRTQTVFTLTEEGGTHCEMDLERDRYIGPAPIPIANYAEAVARQTVRKNRFDHEGLPEVFSGLVLDQRVFDAIGPAVNSGRSLFVHGPAGNGKTSLCQRLAQCFGGDIFIPHAVFVDHLVIKVFDEAVHHEVKLEEEEPLWDERWVRCQRPMVLGGGDLTLDDLDLKISLDVKYYEAPFQIKANGGVLLIDDFGRQMVSPKALLNRWIVPLESEYDFLVAHTGKKLCVPFDVFVVFSTNLDPSELVDEAFLRRVRYKVEVKRPDAARYMQIFMNESERLGLRFDPKMLDYLVTQHYQSPKRSFNACEPRDLLEQVVDVCTYRGIEPMLSKEIIDQVIANYFVGFKVK